MVALFAQQSNVIEFPQPQGKSNEWYTPARYIEAAREVMGGIELDPASCKEANLIVRAERFYTAKDNGLIQVWKARSAWLNPPYGSLDVIKRGRAGTEGVAKPFIFKLIQEHKQGNIKQAILCVTTDTDAKWFIPLWEYPICFADHKVMFHRPGLSNQGQFFGTSFVYLGPHEQKFIDTFSKFGTIAKRVSTPRQTVTPLSLWEVKHE